MSPARKKTVKTAKSPARKKTTSRATKPAARKAAAKKSPRKKTAPAATRAKATPKAKAKATPKRLAPPPSKPRAAKTEPAKKLVKAPPRPRRAVKKKAPLPRVATSQTASHLGVKYVCFECGAKFYDLNRPEPLCPKCGADQRKRPKTKTGKAAAKPADRAGRVMAPLLQEEAEAEAAVVREDEGVELGLGAVDAPDAEETSDEDEEET